LDQIRPLTDIDPGRFATPAIVRRLTAASRRLAELKGVALSIPNQAILVNSLGMQEAKDSSAIENIVTTHDELFKEDAFPELLHNPAAKEVRGYRQALLLGFDLVQSTSLITVNHILAIQEEVEGNSAGFRRLPGTVLKDGAGRTVYTPPQDHDAIVRLMRDLERFINDESLYEADPLVKMALIHHQFESIHPFYDGNGRTGRILNVLHLVQQGLLDTPVLYLSRYIVRNKAAYYQLLQDVRNKDAWEEWVIYMLEAVDRTAGGTMATIHAIGAALLDYKRRIRAGFRFYNQDLINSLFSHPYSKIGHLERELGVSRLTATRYLDQLTAAGFLTKHRIGTSNYYVNTALYGILTVADEHA